MATDLLVKLYDLPDSAAAYQRIEQYEITIHRAMGLDRSKILDFIKENFSPAWIDECTVALAALPSTCYIAVRDKKIIGFACFDATAKGFFGPTGVSESCRSMGVGTALLYRTMEAMREAGYGYAAIGLVSDALEFYKKELNVIEIPDSFPGVYRHMIDQN